MNRFVRFLRELKARRNTPAVSRARLTVESLEDRLVPSTVSGVVFNDVNNNGAMDPGDAGIAGVTVTLTDASNHKVTATTDANGAFSFANVAAGTYKLSESAPSGYLNGQATAGSLGGSAGTGVISDIVVGASDGTGYTFGELAKSAGWSAVQSNFNGTAIQAGTTLWFSSAFKINGVGSTPVTLRVTGQTITFAANGTNYDIAVPDSVITIDPTAKTATTSFDATSNTWRTTLPTQFSGNGFLGAVAVPVTTALPGGINPVTWQGQFTSDTKGLSVNWQWATAVYTSFSTDYNSLNVKPVDDNHVSSYQNSDHAGTPEAFTSFVIGGARGGGGSNYTGSLSSTASVTPPVINPAAQPASVSGYVTDMTGAFLSGVVIDLVSQGTTIKVTTDQFGFYQFTNVPAGTYTLQVEASSLPNGDVVSSATPGTLGGTQTASETINLSLASGQNGFNYDFTASPFVPA